MKSFDALRAQDNAAVLANSRFAREVDDIVSHVKATKGYGERRARRYVGRRITRDTLAYWRVYGVFPIGFRNGSKPRPARLHGDSGRWAR